MTQRPLTILAGLFLAACAADGPQPDFEGPRRPDRYQGGLVVTPSPVRFEETVAGCTRSVGLELRNTSELAITVEAVTVPDDAFLLSEPPPIVLGPGAGRSAALHFTPAAAGRRAGRLAFVTDEAQRHPYELPVSGTAVPRPPRAAGAPEPLDQVIVVDVSTTMDETRDLREALRAAFELVEAGGLDVRFGLVSFENDVRVHAGGTFLERAELLRELDSQLVEGAWTPDPGLSRQLLNFDFAENVLDALYRGASDFDFRPDARRQILLVTDDTFLEPPKVFSDGTPAVHAYDEVARALGRREVRLFSVHEPTSGRGLSAPHGGQPSLVAASGGAWFPISGVGSGDLDLGALLADLLAGPVCP